MKFKAHKGQNLIEALFALSIFFVFVVGSLILMFRYLDTTLKAKELQASNTIAIETYEALAGLSQNSFLDLTPGTYGLSKTSGYWSLDAEPDIIKDRFTRTVTISTVNRDDDCEITETGGTDDPDSRLIQLSIDWDSGGHTLSQNFNKYFTNYSNPTNCIVDPGPGGQAGGVSLNTAGATRNEFFSWINLLVNIDNVFVLNISDEPVTIDKVQVFMSEPTMDIYRFKIDGSTRWGWFGPGSPSGDQPSGTVIDIADYAVDPDDEIEIDMSFFTGESGPITFSINFIMADETEVETDEFTL